MTAAALLLALVSLAWLDPHAAGREGNRLYGEGSYDDAAAQYNQALVDDPDSPALHFNLGDAAYKQGKYDDAVKAFEQVPSSDGGTRIAPTAYNVGNAKYRLGEAAESSDPQAALKLYAEAMVAYRRAIGTAPDDIDAKFNYEFVEKKLADLKKKLEEQQQQQEQQPQDQQDQRDQQDQQNQEQPPQDQQAQERQDQKEAEQNQEKEQKEQGEPQQEQAQGPEQQQQEAGARAEEQPAEGEMTRQEAAALLDSQRDQEVQPEEVIRKLQGAVVGEPAQDW